MAPSAFLAPRLSVVIPTRDRRELLRLTLEALAEQEGFGPGELEVVVADDGSSDGTEALLAGTRPAAFRLRWVKLAGAGPAAARNRAVAIATSERVLLLGDDTPPYRTTLRAHIEAAAGGQVGTQGPIEWDPEREITPVMKFLAPAGPQFYFKGLRSGRPVPYTAVLGSNLSVPRSWLLDDPFDENFPSAAFEDTELAYRWKRKGRCVIFASAAVCRHRHVYDSIGPFLERQHRAGQAARYSIGRHPAMAARTILQPLALGVAIAARHGFRRLVGCARETDRWDLMTRGAFFRGFLQAPRRDF
jgi:glycosyltransferase involved in cell wall biosynthesis